MRAWNELRTARANDYVPVLAGPQEAAYVSRPVERSTHVALLTGGGDKPYALGIAASLLSLGVKIDFIGSNELDVVELRREPLVRFLNLRGNQSPDTLVLTKIWRVFAYYLRLARYAFGAEPRVFHILWNNRVEWFDRTLLLLYYRLLGKRLVFTAHNVNAGRRDGKDTWLNGLTLQIQYRLVDHVFVHTRKMSEELQVEFNVPACKIGIIPFGINHTVPDTEMTSQEAKNTLGLMPNERTLLFFGHIAPYKGLDVLLQALAELVQEDDSYRLIVAGRPKDNDSYWTSLQACMSAPKLKDHIILRSEYIPDVETEIYFKGSDLLVLPYTHIYQSGVLVLGYNFGLPVIASDVGSFKEDIIEGETGYIFGAQDVRDLARSIQRYFSSAMYLNLEASRRRIRAIALERYSWKKVGVSTTQAYEDLLRDGRYT